MAQTYTYADGTGDLASTFPFTFPYLKEADVKVSVLESGVWIQKTKDTHYEFATATTLKFKSYTEDGVTYGAPADGTNNIKIYRSTSADKLTATFYPGSAIRSADLNDNFTQNLYSTEESKEASEAAFQSDGSTALKSTIVFNGSDESNDIQTTLSVTNPTGSSKTITLPNITGTVITTGDTGTVTSTMITDGTIVNADINASAAIAQSKLNIANATTSAAGYASAADKTKLDGIETAATADQTAAEIRTLVESASDSNVFTDADHTKLNGIETAATADQTNAEIRTAVEAASDSNVFTDADHSKLDGIAASANNYSISSDLLDEDNFASDSATKPPSQQSTKAYIAATSEPKSARLTQLAGMQSGTASILADSTALTSTTTKLNLLTDKSVETTIVVDSSNPTDQQLPTAKAVNDHVVNLINNMGGFTPIDDHEKFPTSNPDPNNDAGTIVSIADAGGLKVADGSGSGDYAGTAGNSIGAKTTGNEDVTITGIDSTLRGTTIAAGKGMLVQTTSTEHTYAYHRLVVDEAGVASAQTLVSDFNERYRVSSGEPTTSLHDGDLVFDTNVNKMKVYDSSASAWKEVTSVGDYKLLTVKDHDQASSGSGPTFNGSNKEFDLFDGSSDANITSVGQLIVSLNGVIQKPNSGTYDDTEEGFYLNDTHGIKFCTAPASGSSLFVTLIGSATTVNVPATNSVATAMIQAGAVTTDRIATGAVATDRIADDAVTAAKLANSINTEIAANTAKVSNATHTGDVTGSTALTIATGAVETGMIADDAVTTDKLANAINTDIAAKAPKANPAFTGQLTEEVEINTSNKLSEAPNLNLSDGNVFLFTTTETGTSTPNLRWDASTALNDKVSTGEALSVTIITTANASAFSAALNIDGTASGVTTNWVGGSAPSAGGSSGVDIHSYTIIKTGSAAYTVIANHSTTS